MQKESVVIFVVVVVVALFGAVMNLNLTGLPTAVESSGKATPAVKRPVNLPSSTLPKDLTRQKQQNSVPAPSASIDKDKLTQQKNFRIPNVLKGITDVEKAKQVVENILNSRKQCREKCDADRDSCQSSAKSQALNCQQNAMNNFVDCSEDCSKNYGGGLPAMACILAKCGEEIAKNFEKCDKAANQQFLTCGSQHMACKYDKCEQIGG